MTARDATVTQKTRLSAEPGAAAASPGISASAKAWPIMFDKSPAVAARSRSFTGNHACAIANHPRPSGLEVRQNFAEMFRNTPDPRCAQKKCISTFGYRTEPRLRDRRGRVEQIGLGDGQRRLAYEHARVPAVLTSAAPHRDRGLVSAASPRRGRRGRPLRISTWHPAPHRQTDFPRGTPRRGRDPLPTAPPRRSSPRRLRVAAAAPPRPSTIRAATVRGAPPAEQRERGAAHSDESAAHGPARRLQKRRP